MLAGIVAGSISAVVAALVSLPLVSPDDALLNSATVVIAALLAGIAAGILWRALANNRRRTLVFVLLWAIGFALAVIFAVAGETQLKRFMSFVLPLAAIIFSITGLLTVALSHVPISRLKWLPIPAVVLALALGIALAGRGDEESGRLEIPPRSSRIPSQALTPAGTWAIGLSGEKANEEEVVS